MKESEIRLKYLELAISILQEQPNNSNKGLRQWAVNLLKENSPVPFVEPKTQTELIEEISLPKFDSLAQQLVQEGSQKYAIYGQFGNTCQPIKTTLESGIDEAGHWLEWKSDSLLKPTTPLGGNIRIDGFEFKLWKSGQWQFKTENFANLSRHSDWNTQVEINFAYVISEEASRLFNANIHIGAQHLHHGQSTKKIMDGQLTQIPSMVFQKLAESQTKLIVCLWSNRTN
jgi:hypothetical protein